MKDKENPDLALLLQLQLHLGHLFCCALSTKAVSSHELAAPVEYPTPSLFGLLQAFFACLKKEGVNQSSLSKFENRFPAFQPSKLLLKLVSGSGKQCYKKGNVC